QGNYSNMREFRQSLYRDSLGPYIQAWEQALQAQLVPRMETSGRDIYVEANVESKLRGSFEEQAQLLSSAIGAPWMTRSEGRARMNLPHVEGSDELVVPLNVLVGGQASPRDSGDQNRGLASRRKARVPAQYKARPPESYTTQARRALEEFFGKQGRSIVARITAGDNDWWDAERWDKELADLLYRLSVLMSTYVGEKTAKELGFEPGDYNVERTRNYLKAVAERIAEQTNETTREQVASALEEDDEETEPLQRVDHVFEVAVESRAEQSSTTFTTTFTAFAAAEAARQTVGSRATKTWIVTSANPRASHARMNGETVGIDEKFSNGMEYPGSIEGGPDEVAGCQCELQINLPRPIRPKGPHAGHHRHRGGPMYTKEFDAKVKAVGKADGLAEHQFEAIVSVFGNQASVGDVVVRGAFADDLKAWEESGDPIPVIWSHSWADPFSHIGHVVKAEETDVGLKIV